MKPAEDSGTSDDGLPDHIFLNDCIRGIADTELTDDMVGKNAAAIAAIADDRDIQALAVGHDARPSSARIRTKLVKNAARVWQRRRRYWAGTPSSRSLRHSQQRHAIMHYDYRRQRRAVC